MERALDPVANVEGAGVPVVTPTRRWWAAAELYRWFARDYRDSDFSDEAAAAQYEYESRGGTSPGWENAYYLGKQRLNLWWADTSKMLNEGTLTKAELYADPTIPQALKERLRDLVIEHTPEQVEMICGLFRAIKAGREA